MTDSEVTLTGFKRHYLLTWFWLKESETTMCLKTFEKKIGLYYNVRLLLPQSFHTWKPTKMARPMIAGWTYKAIISSKQNLLEATTVACYLVKFYTVHVIAAKLAIRTLHFVTIFSTELKYDEKKITQLTNWCWQFPDLLLSKDYFSSQFLFFLTCCSSISPTLFTTVSAPSLAFRRSKKFPE